MICSWYEAKSSQDIIWNITEMLENLKSELKKKKENKKANHRYSQRGVKDCVTKTLGEWLE